MTDVKSTAGRQAYAAIGAILEFQLGERHFIEQRADLMRSQTEWFEVAVF